MVQTRSQTSQKSVFINSYEIYDDDKDNSRMYGYKFNMSNPDMNIIARMSSETQCCEKIGAYTITKDLDKFIGAKYYSLTISDIIKDEEESNWEKEMLMIKITISTDRGDIVLYLYNYHNGFYNHNVYVQSEYGMKTINI